MHRFMVLLKKKRVALFLLLFFVINLSFIGFYFFQSKDLTNQAVPQAQAMEPEIKGILETKNDQQKVTLYTQLIERLGPEKAQDALYFSGLPFDGQSHLLNHTVGDWLYEKYNTGGLIHCKDYFLSSCYHGFVIRVIAENGFSDLDNVMQSCWKVNGATTATQCAHAIGHGVLGWENYKNLPDALTDCDTVATLSQDFPTYNCYDGVFMENNWAVHNDGKPSPDRWIKLDDPTYPCNDSRIAEKYRKACWSNQPQMMYKDIFKGDLVKVAAECTKLENTEYKETCFDSLARQINPLTQGNPQQVFLLCDKMPVGWKNACVLSNVSAFFSVGDRNIPFTLCAMIPREATAACYDLLQERVFSYEHTFQARLEGCQRVPKEYQNTACQRLQIIQ